MSLMVRTARGAENARHWAPSPLERQGPALLLGGLLIISGTWSGSAAERPVGVHAAKSSPAARISMDVRDADVQNVLRLIASRADWNLVLSSQVQGHITLRLMNVTCQDALQAVLLARGLGAVSLGTVLRIAPLAELEQEAASQAALLGAKNDASSLETRLVRLWNADAHALQATVQPFLSSRGKVEVDARTNSLILTDTPENLRRMVGLIQGQP